MPNFYVGQADYITALNTLATASDVIAIVSPLVTSTAISTHAATSKTTPADADELAITNSAGTFELNKITIANLKTAIFNPPLATSFQATTLNKPSIRPSLLLDFANTRKLDPRITFARTSTATFYDQTSTGMAEQNLLLQSQIIGGTGWTLTSTTATTSTAVAPDITTTGSLITAVAATAAHYVFGSVTVNVGQSYTVSVYAKAGTDNYVQLAIASDATPVANFDLSLGVVGTVSGATSSITSVGSGWYRCAMTYTAATAAVSACFILVTSASAARFQSWTAVGIETLYLWGAQFEQRSAVTAYTPTTTAAITNYTPILQTAASGVARFDCNPTTGESLGLLIEESRTNLLINGECLGSNAMPTGWAVDQGFGGLIPINYINNTYGGYGSFSFSIYGTTTAVNRLLISPTNSQITVLPNTAYTLSYNCNIANGIYAYALVPNFMWYDAGAVLLSSTNGTQITPTNTYTRYNTTVTTPANAVSLRIRLDFNGYGTASTVVGFTMRLGGLQLEAGSFATSYIPTTTSAITRAAESASMTGTNFSSWFNAGAGTFYAEGIALSVNSNARIISSQSSTTEFLGYSGASNSQVANMFDGTTLQTGNSFAYGSVFKMAGSYTVTVKILTLNGSTPATTAISSGFQGTTSIQFCPAAGSNYSDNWIKRITYYPVALTSTQLVTLTT